MVECKSSNGIEEFHEFVDESDENLTELYPQLNLNFTEELESLPQVQEFINSLKKIIEKQHKKLKKLRNRLKKNETTDTETQTEEIVAAEPKSIVDDITEAATSAVEQTGFVYEASSGLYYDYKTGYYYNAEYGLYYDGTNGIYYRYNEETQGYDFHSKVELPSPPVIEISDDDVGVKPKRKSRNNDDREDTKRVKRKDTSSSRIPDAVEEGECSDTSSDEDQDNPQEIANAWPPCMRIIITESKLEKLVEGTLFIITCDGGTLGREGNHSILIPDINVSKHHATFSFNRELNYYEIVDLGSRNGTLLDGKRMSVAKRESEPLQIKHNSIIQVGNTKLLCHIHHGNETCNDCEPGLQRKVVIKEKTKVKKEDYKSELQRLRKKFGVTSAEVVLAEGYSDRAQKRRETVGSSVPNAKTETASLDQSISKENKGFKLLKGMGWSEGESLGKESKGRTEPIPLVGNVGHAGLGAGDEIPVVPLSKQSQKKDKLWRKMQERFQQSENSLEDDTKNIDY